MITFTVWTVYCMQIGLCALMGCVLFVSSFALFIIVVVVDGKEDHMHVQLWSWTLYCQSKVCVPSKYNACTSALALLLWIYSILIHAQCVVNSSLGPVLGVGDSSFFCSNGRCVTEGRGRWLAELVWRRQENINETRLLEPLLCAFLCQVKL